MNGNASASKCERAVLKTKSEHFKFSFHLRCFVILSVILVYFTISLMSTDFEVENKVLADSSFHQQGRKLLIYTSNEDNGIPTLRPTIIAAVENCTSPAILAFPADGLTRRQRQQGWIVLHILLALYSFGLLAIICDDYFVPAIEQICLNTKIQKDVIGATFMAAATASPELFMNCVGTFVTKGDIGVGTTVGSAVFNILAVPACCGLFIGRYVRVRLDWWPVTRDCLMYCLAVVALIGTLSDGKIMWYEALGLVLGYVFYMAVMYYNDKMALLAHRILARFCRPISAPERIFREVNDLTPLLRGFNSNSSLKWSLRNRSVSQETLDIAEKCTVSTDCREIDFADSPWQRNGRSWPEFLLRWPITLVLWLTIPDSRRHVNCQFITLLLSVAWIGVVSYIVAFIITVIGDSLDIPDSVMGLTILAAGTSIPDAISSIIVTKHGQGAMGISNSIGSNTFDILLCLGLPWFIKSYFLPTNPAENWIALNSTGFTYSAVLLLATLFGLFVLLLANRFVLDWKVGLACTIMYICFMVTASMIELNFFFPVNVPVCRD